MEVRRSVQAASIGELAWLPAAGQRPCAEPVTPLLLDGVPAVAFPYARAQTARALASARQVALLLSDDRMSGAGWRPLVVGGCPRLVTDPAGEVFTRDLLDQELRKFPPARALIDSILLRREHWWYLPRLILTIPVETVAPVAARAGGAGEVLAVAAAGQLRVDTVRRLPGPDDRPRLSSLAGALPAGGPAVLLGHDFSVPDLECWTAWCTTGELAGDQFTVASRPGRTTLERPPGLWRRLRRHRELARECRRGLAEHASTGAAH